MRFPQLAQQFALCLVRGRPDWEALALAQRACDYAEAVGQEIARRLPSEAVPGPRWDVDVARLLAYSNALFVALDWPLPQRRQWLLEKFGKKTRHDLTEMELERMIVLLLDELSLAQKDKEVEG